MTGKITVKQNITATTNRIVADLNKLPAQAYRVFVENTPVKSGNARRRTKLRGDTIDAAYPYAERLNEGYSKQSPDGMWEPTEKYIQQQLDKIMRK